MAYADDKLSDAGGNFSLTETANDNHTVSTTGNSVAGTQTVTTTGQETDTIYETNANGSDNYALNGGGVNTFTTTETDDTTAGTANSTTTGSDVYGLTETGQHGAIVYTQNLGGTDVYTTTVQQDSLTGLFSSITSGADGYTRNESGTNSGTPFSTSDSGSNLFSSTLIGDTFSGAVSLSQTGTSRYGLLEQFNNTSAAANGGAGMGDFASVGLPILMGRASVPAGTFRSIGDAQYQYCFAAGTQVLMADGTTKAIETIEPGAMVLACPENDPESKPVACRVAEVYRNPPAKLLAVTIRFENEVADAEPVLTTGNHPFYVRGQGWMHAEDLVPGDSLRTDDGAWAQVQQVKPTGRTEPVFNLQVEESHTYFVKPVDSSTAVLVHNDSNDVPATPVSPYLAEIPRIRAADWQNWPVAPVNEHRLIIEPAKWAIYDWKTGHRWRAAVCAAETINEALIISSIIKGLGKMLVSAPSTFQLFTSSGAAATSEVTLSQMVPKTIARVVPGNINLTTLGITDQVFVTDAFLLRGLSAAQIAEKLEIPATSSFKVIEFSSEGINGIAVPIRNPSPGFVGKGFTSGGLSEFVMPNGPIPSGSVIRSVP